MQKSYYYLFNNTGFLALKVVQLEINGVGFMRDVYIYIV